MRIIDRDFDFYDSMVDHHARGVRIAPNGEEARHIALRDAARDVRDALAHYRGLIDRGGEETH